MAAKRKENAVINHHLIVNALEDAESVIPVETSLPRPPVNVEAASALQLSFRSQFHAIHAKHCISSS